MPIVLVESIFILAAHGDLSVVDRGVLDCLACHRDCHSLVEPVHGVDPLRRDQNLVPEPPVARIEDEIPHGPRLLVEQHAGDMTDVAVTRVDVIADDSIAAAKVRIIVLVLRRFASRHFALPRASSGM